MKTQMLASVNQEIYRRFPILAGKRPRIQSYRAFTAALLGAGRGASGSQPAYLMIYKGQAAASDRTAIPIVVRVLVDRQGKILKISSSR
jgi:hypothetical protein